MKLNEKITEDVYAPVLRTGDLFMASTRVGGTVTYEFIGFAPFDETGCSYLIMRNVETGDFNGVEINWFREQVCGRKIKLINEEERKDREINTEGAYVYETNEEI